LSKVMVVLTANFLSPALGRAGGLGGIR
jgi:hypothetical protein